MAHLPSLILFSLLPELAFVSKVPNCSHLIDIQYKPDRCFSSSSFQSPCQRPDPLTSPKNTPSPRNCVFSFTEADSAHLHLSDCRCVPESLISEHPYDKRVQNICWRLRTNCTFQESHELTRDEIEALHQF